jgi:hypothetical protein
MIETPFEGVEFRDEFRTISVGCNDYFQPFLMVGPALACCY